MTTKSDRPEHWALRASTYSQLKWVSNRRLLDFMVACAELKPHHRLLDAGTGNGAVAQACAPHVGEVLAVDFCHDMLAQRNTNQHHNLRFEVADLRQLPYPDACFDRVTARNVFHNILAERD
ncbi:MAG: class I SAM-dependent methyltransferase, partial [Terriglobia bacterium]